ncbi:MAG: RloB domain-containing protein [Elusimicrobium sp.]|uniref:RloB domain-containing protein n=1 Tax=Candidatus Avelusimicrobium gallicola TaxID=2562704 RepID=A0A928HE38_9BACT|nr:RloB domain-containing protein [Elusimicrobium sp.]
MKRNRSLIRRINLRQTKKPIVIITNGETEEIYFNGFKDRDSSYVLHIRRRNSAPQNLPRQVSNILQGVHLRGSSPEIWLVVDKDNFPIEKAAALTKAKKYYFAYSIPSVEIWFLLHFCYTSASMTPAQAINRLSSYLDLPYEKTKDYFELLAPHQITAINHAKKLEQHHMKQKANLLKANPYTNIYMLVEKLTRH